METIKTITGSVKRILEHYRAMSLDAVEENMSMAFLEIKDLLESNRDAIVLPLQKGICGISASTFSEILSHPGADQLELWLIGGADGEKYRLLKEFLNTPEWNMLDIRSRFPNSFMKWSESEEKSLCEDFDAAKGAPSWQELSARYGRNSNALKLRLCRLGKMNWSEAGVLKRFSGPNDGICADKAG